VYSEIAGGEVAGDAAAVVDEGDAADLVVEEDVERVNHRAVHAHTDDGLDQLQRPDRRLGLLGREQVGLGHGQRDDIRQTGHVRDRRSFVLVDRKEEADVSNDVPCEGGQPTHRACWRGGDGDTVEAVLEARRAEEVDEVLQRLALFNHHSIVASREICGYRGTIRSAVYTSD
jgi:hypothetical protein